MKDNQPELARRIADKTGAVCPADSDANRHTGRGRQEDRKVDVFPADEILAGTSWHDLVKTIVRVERNTLIQDARTGMWKRRDEVSFYLSSAEGLPAGAWNSIVRGHWGIENRNHYVRDVTLAEDASRIRKNPGIVARFRSFALNIMRFNGVTNVAQNCWSGALDLNVILAYRGL